MPVAVLVSPATIPEGVEVPREVLVWNVVPNEDASPLEGI
jgi:hypothetical protein